MKVQVYGSVDIKAATELERVAKLNGKNISQLLGKIVEDWFESRQKEVTCKCGAKHSGILDVCPSCGENHV